MADVITRLKVESNEYDNKLKRASQSLLSMQEAARRTGATMAIADKEEVKFAQSLGNMQTVARNAKGKLGEMTNALTEMSIVYKRMTDEEKKGEFGRALNASIQQLTQRCKEAKAELADVTNSLGGANNSFSEFTNGIGLNIGSLTKMGVAIGAAKMALDGLQAAVANNIETAMNFEYSMSKLQSLTGMAGDDLNTLKRKAIELGSSTTQSASQVADAFAIIGSKRPDLLSSAYALSDVTEAAIKMSEAAGMEVPEAADALAAALNIFQLQSDQATRVINVLAAGSKLGAAGIQELGEMTFRAGGSAKKAGLSFEEFAAAAEIIRPAFGSAEDAGQALNKFLSKLEEKMTNNYKPSVVGFQQAMVNLKNANLDSNESLKIFTVNGVKAYDAIMANVDGLEKMTKGVTGTNTAYEQAAINTNNLKGSLANLSSAWEGLNLSINDSNGALKGMVDWLTSVVSWANTTFTKLGNIKKKMDEINNAMGHGGTTRVQHELQMIGGSNHKEEAQRGIGHQYDVEIKANNDKIAKLQAQIKTLGNTGSTMDGGASARGAAAQITQYNQQIADLRRTNEALLEVKKEFYARSNALIRGASSTPTTESEDLGGGGHGNVTVGTSKGNHTGTHKKTPAEQAAERVANAQLDYAQTIEKADIRMEAGLDDTLAHKKKELSAQERLFDAYSDAYATYADPKYRAMLDESATSIGKLSEEVKSLEGVAAQAKADAKAAQDRANLVKKTRAADGTADFGIFNKSSVDDYIKYLKDGVQNSTIGTDMFNAFTAKLADTNALKNVIETALNNGIDISSFNTQGLWDKILSTGGDALSDETLQKLIDEINTKLNGKKISLNFATGDIDTENVKPEKKGIENQQWFQDTGKVVNGLSQVASGLQSMGLKIPESVQKVITAIQGAMTVVQGVSSIISVFGATSEAANTAATTANTVAIGALTTALAANTAAVSANSVASLIPFNNGGFLHAANGVITGSHFSGDVQPLMVNAGEGVINQADQANLWRAIKEGNFGGGGSIQSVGVRGTDLLLCLNNELRSQGKPTL